MHLAPPHLARAGALLARRPFRRLLLRRGLMLPQLQRIRALAQCLLMPQALPFSSLSPGCYCPAARLHQHPCR